MKYQIVIADNKEKLESGEEHCTNSKEELCQMMCECLENGKAFSVECIKDKKLYCMHVSRSIFNPAFYMCSANAVIKNNKLDKDSLTRRLRSDAVVRITDDEPSNIFFSYDVECLKQKAYAEIQSRVDKLKSVIKTLEKIDIENLPGISKEQEGE